MRNRYAVIHASHLTAITHVRGRIGLQHGLRKVFLVSHAVTMLLPGDGAAYNKKLPTDPHRGGAISKVWANWNLWCTM